MQLNKVSRRALITTVLGAPVFTALAAHAEPPKRKADLDDPTLQRYMRGLMLPIKYFPRNEGEQGYDTFLHIFPEEHVGDRLRLLPGMCLALHRTPTSTVFVFPPDYKGGITGRQLAERCPPGANLFLLPFSTYSSHPDIYASKNAAYFLELRLRGR